MTTTPQRPTSAPVDSAASAALGRLRATSAVLAVLVLVQLGLGIFLASKSDASDAIYNVHGWVGYLATLVAIVAAVFAWSWSKQSGRRGVFFHALSLPLLCIIQIGLAEADLKWVHVVLGVVYAAAVFGLFSMLRRR